MTEGFGPKVTGFDHFVLEIIILLKRKLTKIQLLLWLKQLWVKVELKCIPDWCLKELRALCNKKKILLILDEVQCGIGRSGDFFAFEKSKSKT